MKKEFKTGTIKIAEKGEINYKKIQYPCN